MATNTATKTVIEKQGVQDWKADPVKFVQEVLGERPYGKQREMLRTVLARRRISVVGCNSSGKDWAAARAILHWMEFNCPAICVVVGPSHRQVNDIVWNEVRKAFGNRRTVEDWGLRLFRTARLECLTSPESHYAIGLSPKDEYNLLGFHSPATLVVVTEAHAVRQEDFDSIRRLNPKCILMTGNPFAVQGEFFNSHHSLRGLWDPINISVFDTPNLGPEAPYDGYPEYEGMATKRTVAERAEEWGEDSPMYKASVLGEFPEDLDDTVVPLSAVLAARERELKGEGPIIVACDVARYGRDKTVVVQRQGAVARILWKVQGRNTDEIAGWLHNHTTHHQPDFMVVDEVGVGAGVVDQLQKFNLGKTRLIPFSGGSKPNDERHYYNATSEAWWLMRKWFLSEQADIESDPALEGQLTGREFSYQSDQKIKLESKEDMSKSPDEADALSMTFAHVPSGLGVWV